MLGSLCALVFFVNFGRVAFAPLVGPLMAEFEVGKAAVGLVVTLVWLGSAVSRVPAGYLLTRVERRDHVVTGTGLVLATAALFTAVAPDLATLSVGSFVIGCATGLYYIAALPFLSELFPARVGRILGLHATASQFAAVGAPLLVGWAITTGTWRHVFVGMAACALVVTGVFVLAVRRIDVPTAGAADRNIVGAARTQWRLILTGVALIGLTAFVWNGVFNFYIEYLQEAKTVSEPTAQAMLTLVFAAGVPAMWSMGRLADRVSPLTLALSITGGFALSLVALTVVQGLVGVAAVSLAMGYAFHGIFPVLDTYMLDSLPDANRASAYSVYSGAMMTIQAAGSVVVGTLVEADVAWDPLFRAFAVGLLLVLVVLVALYRGEHLPTSGAPA